MRKRRRIVGGVLTALLASCGGDNPTLSREQALHPYDAPWAGVTSQGRSVYFRVAESRIVSFETVLTITPICTSGVKLEPKTPIQGDVFAFQIFGTPGAGVISESDLARGRFESPLRASGRIPARTHPASATCGNAAPVVRPEVTFTAEARTVGPAD